ncbi:MAG: PfkB family carbohydrate kinase [candidate division FCPU426 bacterium]
MKLVIVGSVALDTLATPAGAVKRALGGAATHAAVAASFFTDKLGIVGVVGDDFPAAFPKLLRSRKIDLGGLSQVTGKTFHWKGRYEGDMAVAKTLHTELGVFAGFDPVLPAAYRSAPFVFCGNIVPEIQSKVLDQASRSSFKVLDTMNLWIATKKKALLNAIKRVDAVVLNDQEIRQLTGVHSLILAAKALLKAGPRFVLLKRGEHGASLISKNEYFHLPAFPTEKVRDPTGAGDSFAGGLIGSLTAAGRVDKGTLRRAMASGIVMSSFQVEDFSLWRTVKLKRPEIENRLKRLRAMTSF